MRACIAVLLLCVALVGCSGPSGNSQATKQASDFAAMATALASAYPSTAAPSAKPTPTNTVTPKVGQTATLAAYSLTLNRVDYPATPSVPPPAGQRLISFDVTILAKVAGLPYNPIYGKVKMADNTEGNPWLVGVDPALQSGSLQNQESVRGWITFAFPQNGQPVTFVYEPTVRTFGDLRVTFDLR